MTQRFPRRTWSPHSGAGHRPRVLIEDDHPALAISDFSQFEQAGLSVGFCSGPGRDRAHWSCPLLQGQKCPALENADAVLHGLDPQLGIAAALRREYPRLPVVVKQRRRDDGRLEEIPQGCAPLRSPASVGGQIETVWRAILHRSSRDCAAGFGA